MLYLNPNETYEGFAAIAWGDAISDDERVARQFVASERSVMDTLRQEDPARAGELTPLIAQCDAFLDAAKEGCTIARSEDGHILLDAGAVALLLDGQSGKVLCDYLDRKRVTIADRSEMTHRIDRRLLGNAAVC